MHNRIALAYCNYLQLQPHTKEKLCSCTTNVCNYVFFSTAEKCIIALQTDLISLPMLIPVQNYACALLQQMSVATHVIFLPHHMVLQTVYAVLHLAYFAYLHILNQMQKCYIQQFLCGFGCIFNLQKPKNLRASLNPKLLPILKAAQNGEIIKGRRLS